MKLKIYILLPILILLFNCANLPSSKIAENFNFSSEEGMVIGAFSIKNEKPIFNGYGLWHKSVDGNEKVTIKNRVWIVPEQMVSMKLKPDFFDGEKGVYYFAFKKPPGNYFFNLVSLFENGGFYTSSGGLEINFPFTVQPRKITYVGEIYLDYRNKKVVQKFLQQRDIPRFEEKFPDINWSQIE